MFAMAMSKKSLVKPSGIKLVVIMLPFVPLYMSHTEIFVILRV